MARLLAILPQVLLAPESISVEDLVWFGRHPHRTSLKMPSSADKDAVEWAMQVTSTTELRHQHVDQLSGGQRQRVWIALCLAQGTDLILLDEPTTYLDVAYQLEVLDLLHQLNQEQGKTVAMVLHDFNMAAEYADHVFVMKSGTPGHRRDAGGRVHLRHHPRRVRGGVEGGAAPGQRQADVHPAAGRPAGPAARGGDARVNNLVLHGGVVWTGDPGRPSATAVAVSDGRITAVGSDAEVLAAHDGERIDLGGWFVCPGFIDAHTHFENACDWFFQVPLTGVTDGADLRARVARTLVGVPPGIWITGGGDFGAELTPRLADLDAVSPDNPVLLRRVDGRYFANTRALRIAGRASSDGLLERQAGEVVQRQAPPVSLAQKVIGAHGVTAELHRLGITSIHDIARHPVLSEQALHPSHVERSYSNLAVFEELRRRDELGVRVYAFLTLDTFEGLAAQGIHPGSGDEWLNYGALKIFMDSGVMLPPFDASRAAGTGLKDEWSYRFVGEEKLLERIVAGDRAGYDIGVHVQGDAAIRMALKCFRHAAGVNPARDRRHRLIHAWHLAEDDFTVAAELGMIADVTPDHLRLYSQGLDELLGSQRAGNAFAWRRMVDAGITTNLVSDFPGAYDRSHVATIDPLRNMHAAMSRTFHPEQALTVDDVLRAYTSAPAYSSRDERRKGTITPGKLADLVVLSDDITRGDTLRTAAVDLTTLDGAVVYRR